MRKVTAAVLALLCLVGIQALMAGGTKEQAKPAAGATKPPVVNIVAWFRDGTEVPADNSSLQHIAEATGTTIAYNALPTEEYDTKLNLLLASGERPEIIAYGTNAMEYDFAKANMLLPLNDYLTTYPEIGRSRPQSTWDAMKHGDGIIYAIPVQSIVLEFAILYRADWLAKLGLSVPKTLDEYYTVAEAVSKRDPDGNGKDDTYAFGGRARVKRPFDHIFAAYGVLPVYFRPDASGKLVEGSTTPQAKEALRFIRRMYENGLIDPEFVTDDSDRLEQKTNAGRFGAAYDYFYVTDTNNIYGHYETWKAQNPTGRWVTGGLLQGPGKNIGLRSESRRGWFKTSVLKEAKNIGAAMKVLNWASSEEGRMFLNYGLPGTHYTLSADGMVKALLGDAEQKKLGINECYFLMDEMMKQTSPQFQATVSYAASVASPDVMDAMEDEVPEINQYWGDLKDLIEVSFLKMIVGETPIDGGFEDFVREFGKSGGTELTNALNAAYARRRSH